MAFFVIFKCLAGVYHFWHPEKRVNQPDYEPNGNTLPLVGVHY